MEDEYKCKIFRRKQAWKAYSKAHNWEVKNLITESQRHLKTSTLFFRKTGIPVS